MPFTFMAKIPLKQDHTWVDEFAVGGRQLVTLIKLLLAKGNVRRLVIYKPNGRVLFQTSLTTGVTVAGVFTILAPVLTAMGALAALLTEVRVKVIYIGNPRR